LPASIRGPGDAGAFVVPYGLDDAAMRAPVDAAPAAREAPLPGGRRGDAAAEPVCLALALAILVLACRIAATW
jgi:hypothetical protein